MRSRRARASDKFKVEISTPDKFTDPPCGFGAKLAFSLACGTARLQHETNKPNIGSLVKNADRVTIDHVNIISIDRGGLLFGVQF